MQQSRNTREYNKKCKAKKKFKNTFHTSTNSFLLLFKGYVICVIKCKT